MCQNVPKEYRFVPFFFGIPARSIVPFAQLSRTTVSRTTVSRTTDISATKAQRHKEKKSGVRGQNSEENSSHTKTLRKEVRGQGSEFRRK